MIRAGLPFNFVSCLQGPFYHCLDPPSFLQHPNALRHHATPQSLGAACQRLVHEGREIASIFLRRLGKLIATLNSIWIFISCMFQLSNFYYRCYCNSDVFWLRGRASNVIQLMANDLAGAKGAWLGGVFLAGGVVVIYVGFVELFRGPPLPD